MKTGNSIFCGQVVFCGYDGYVLTSKNWHNNFSATLVASDLNFNYGFRVKKIKNNETDKV